MSTSRVVKTGVSSASRLNEPTCLSIVFINFLAFLNLGTKLQKFGRIAKYNARFLYANCWECQRKRMAEEITFSANKT
jgi:hypothetical protein